MPEALLAHGILDDFLYVSIGAFCGSYLVLATYEATLLNSSRQVSRQAFNRPSSRACDSPLLQQLLFNACFCSMVLACFMFLMNGVRFSTDIGFLGAVETLYMTLTSRFLTGALRLLTIRYTEQTSKRTVLFVNLIGLLMISTTAVNVCKHSFEYTDNDILNAFVTSISVAFSEIISLAFLSSFTRLRMAKMLQSINTWSLENLMDAHSLIQEQVYIFYGHFWSEESAGMHATKTL